MSYDSVDALQKMLADTVFSYARDQKKAAGRALGTLIEIITYYTLVSWGLRDHIVIEHSVPEFANPDIVHNVEFSLHNIIQSHETSVADLELPITPAKIRKKIAFIQEKEIKAGSHLLSSNFLKRNSALLSDTESSLVVANLDTNSQIATACELYSDPFAIVECKRVGVEGGMKKGPQTIEKAKQGAYVSMSVSSLQKIRLRNGVMQGILENNDGTLRIEQYNDILHDIINVMPAREHEGFILTIGVVSNHGNWFTTDHQNKELKVLAQSYDWLLFLTDEGLSTFIEELLLNPKPGFEDARSAFLASYPRGSNPNRFTKVKICSYADDSLLRYFKDNKSHITEWYNVISPSNGSIDELQHDLYSLALKERT